MNLSAETEVNYSSPVIVTNRVEHQRTKNIFSLYQGIVKSCQRFWE